MTTNTGPLSDETDESLVHDVACVLVNYTRDRPGGGLIGRRLQRDEAQALAQDLVTDLAPRIGGRYLPKIDQAQRRRRDAQVLADFDGRNHAEVMRRHKISRRLLFNIIARGRVRK